MGRLQEDRGSEMSESEKIQCVEGGGLSQASVHNAVIIYRRDLNHELFVIRVSPLEGDVPSFMPGQFTDLGLVPPEAAGLSEAEQRKVMVRRNYSIASAPVIRNYLEFYIVKVEGGQLTEPLHKLGEGDTLYMGMKGKGKFTLDDIPNGKDLIMVATGTGLAPYMSMLREYHGQGLWNSFTIVHGARLACDLGYKDEISEFVKSSDDVFYIPSATRESSDSVWPKHRGRIPALLEGGVYESETGRRLDPDNCHVFLCGNPQMIEDLQQQLESKNFRVHKRSAPGNIHVERYW